ncbi:MAG TPA: outer membrane beta-barrel protein [Saprospiraceae bacterium]|nr:outer membrane beta-barrel protein [Saprospiraceae bacterium]HMP25353.1 outer membrane beta-barrel protein [Saprospiraceae bacterium]
MLVLWLGVCTWSQGQSASLAIDLKAGGTFARWEGPLEDLGTRTLEDFTYRTDFHAGLGLLRAFNDFSGLRFELLYSRKGTHYRFNGPSYWFFPTNNGGELFSIGTRKTELSIRTNYLELPVLYYLRINRIEFSVGAGGGWLLGAQGQGTLLYSGISESGSAVAPFSIALDFDYLRDPLPPIPSTDGIPRLLDGELVRIPRQMSAYDEYAGTGGRYLHFREVYLLGGVAFFLTRELYLDFRFNYGLANITNPAQDASLTRVNPDKSRILRDDYDRNMAWLVSAGIRF